jgi:primase-polymerase (primpol)-like protein
MEISMTNSINGTKLNYYIDKLNSYTEISPSGTGVHIYTKAKLPSTGRRKNNIEFYNSGRYFTVTGWHLEGTPPRSLRPPTRN